MNYSTPGGSGGGGKNDYLPENESQTKRLIGSSVVLIALSTIFVLLRLLSRRLSKAGFWWDDASILLALILSYGLPIGNLARIQYEPDELAKWLKNFYVLQIFYITSVSAVKYSILLFYQRIFPLPQFRTPLLITHLVVTGFMVSCFFATVFQCTPIRLFWLRISVDGSRSPIKGKCVNFFKILISTGSVNAVLDFFVLGLPIPFLWRLKTSKLQKTLLTVIFGIATFVCAVSIIRLIVLRRIPIDDNTWMHSDVPVWTATEVSMGIVSACIPSLRPLITFFLHRGGRGCNIQIFRGTQLSAATTSSISTVYPPYNNNNNNHNHNKDNNHNNPISSHSRLHLKPEKAGGGDFLRLNSEAGDAPMVPSAWGHEVIVHASGRGKERPDGVRGEKNGGDDIEMLTTPPGGIRVKTEITLTREKRIDYLDRLY